MLQKKRDLQKLLNEREKQLKSSTNRQLTQHELNLIQKNREFFDRLLSGDIKYVSEELEIPYDVAWHEEDNFGNRSQKAQFQDYYQMICTNCLEEDDGTQQMDLFRGVHEDIPYICWACMSMARIVHTIKHPNGKPKIIYYSFTPIQ